MGRMWCMLFWFGLGQGCVYGSMILVGSSSCACFSSESSVGAVMMRVVSSAYVYILECLVEVVMSLM